MCRFALYLGSPILVSSLLTEPAHSLIHQSVNSREREEPLNGDGFGIAWYVPEITPEPAVFREVSPAWSNRNLVNIAKVTMTGCLLAHIRAATPGIPVTVLNCHPFPIDRFACMHNGDTGDFRRIARPMRERLSEAAYHRVKGSTDSESIFGLFADAHDESSETDPLLRMADALTSAIAQVVELNAEHGVTAPATLNLAVSDGVRAVVSRFHSHDPELGNSLYVRTGGRYECRDGLCWMSPDDGARRAVIVASEPLSADRGWRKVSPNHLLLVSDTLEVTELPIGVACAV